MHPELSIRPGTEDDAEAIARLVTELGYPASAETVRERIARLTGRSDHLLAVTELDRQVCGWLQAHSSEVLESGFRVEILGLITAKNARRRGVGRLLVGRAEAWAIDLGAQTIVVRSNITRPESHPFYLALGYQNTKTQMVYRKQVRTSPAPSSRNSPGAEIPPLDR